MLLKPSGELFGLLNKSVVTEVRNSLTNSKATTQKLNYKIRHLDHWTRFVLEQFPLATQKHSNKELLPNTLSHHRNLTDLGQGMIPLSILSFPLRFISKNDTL